MSTEARCIHISFITLFCMKDVFFCFLLHVTGFLGVIFVLLSWKRWIKSGLITYYRKRMDIPFCKLWEALTTKVIKSMVMQTKCRTITILNQSTHVLNQFLSTVWIFMPLIIIKLQKNGIKGKYGDQIQTYLNTSLILL